MFWSAFCFTHTHTVLWINYTCIPYINLSIIYIHVCMYVCMVISQWRPSVLTGHHVYTDWRSPDGTGHRKVQSSQTVCPQTASYVWSQAQEVIIGTTCSYMKNKASENTHTHTHTHTQHTHTHIYIYTYTRTYTHICIHLSAVIILT